MLGFYLEDLHEQLSGRETLYSGARLRLASSDSNLRGACNLMDTEGCLIVSLERCPERFEFCSS